MRSIQTVCYKFNLLDFVCTLYTAALSFLPTQQPHSTSHIPYSTPSHTHTYPTPGLFVRASIPDRHANLRYRLMIITDITTTPKPYPVESTISNCRLKLNIILRANQRSEKEIPISSISSALPTQVCVCFVLPYLCMI